MNLIDALKTKLPIRRPIEKHWGSNKSGYISYRYAIELLTQPSNTWRNGSLTQRNMIDETDLMADDWCVCTSSSN